MKRLYGGIDMADIIINDDRVVKGKLSFSQVLDESKDPPVLTISGSLSTHRYFEDLHQIETERYLLKDVKVFSESFGSDDFNVIYTFIANGLKIKGGETPFDDDYITKTENELYGGESNGGK
jgi:hypothetical protein